MPDALAQARVFPREVTTRTTMIDFMRAGLAREVTYTTQAGRTATKIEPIPDASGRIVDLHALRTTLGTNLARAGVAPQIAQKIMRHADYKTTLAHYTALRLSDSRGAIDAIPSIESKAEGEAIATGTGGRARNMTLYPVQNCAFRGLSRRDSLVLTDSVGGNESPGITKRKATRGGKRRKGVEPSTASLEG
jgi:hypothetical protein